MKILTIQIDGKWENLALIKIRAYHRGQGDTINGITNPDRVYISCVFEANEDQAMKEAAKYPGSDVWIGGSGFNLFKDLAPEIENVIVDWDAEGLDYAMGFTSRGCIRKCDFCIVWKKEGHIREHHSISHISNGKTNLVLIDGNFLASPRKIEKLKELRDNGYRVNFNQGLDLRVMTPEIAGLLADIKYTNFHRTRKQLHFAWDYMSNRVRIIQGLYMLIDAGIPPADIMVYTLCGFDTTHEEDYERFRVLRDELKVLPYVMVYNNRKDDLKLRAWARFINKRVYKSCSWEDYDRRPAEGSPCAEAEKR